MSKLEDLVPPLYLCKNIDQNEFAGSALAWFISLNGKRWVAPRGSNRIENGECLFAPAPTLAEIFAKLPQTASVTWFTQEEYPNSYAVGCYILQRKPRKAKLIVEIDDNPATAALKLWLNVKGIK